MFKPGQIVVCIDDDDPWRPCHTPLPLTKGELYVVRQCLADYGFINGPETAVWLQETKRDCTKIPGWHLTQWAKNPDVQDFPWGASRFAPLNYEHTDVKVSKHDEIPDVLKLRESTLVPSTKE